MGKGTVKVLAGLMLAVVGVIHLLPLAGVLGADRLATLYAVELADPNLVVLMRHRAVLFGVLGAFLLLAAFRVGWRVPALAAGGISVVSFLWLAYADGPVNEVLQRVVLADWIALGCLAVAGVLEFLRRHQGKTLS